MYKYIDYYEQKPKEKKEGFHRGQFYWSCFPFAFSSPRVTRFWCNRPTETLDTTKFNSTKEKFDPDNKTEADEFLAITQYKRRPVLLLSTPIEKYDTKGFKGGEYYLVAPLRSLRIKETNEYKFSAELIWKSILYSYSSLFYLPDSIGDMICESFVLFERTTTLHQSWLSPCDSIQLSTEALYCVDMWFRNFIFGNVPTTFKNDIDAYRTAMGESPVTKNEVLGIGSYLKNPK